MGRQFSGSCPPGFRYQPLTSPYLREKLGVVGVLGPDQGVVVTGIEAWARGEEGGCPLQEGDVLVEVDGEGGAGSHGGHKLDGGHRAAHTLSSVLLVWSVVGAGLAVDEKGRVSIPPDMVRQAGWQAQPKSG